MAKLLKLKRTLDFKKAIMFVNSFSTVETKDMLK